MKATNLYQSMLCRCYKRAKKFIICHFFDTFEFTIMNDLVFMSLDNQNGGGANSCSNTAASGFNRGGDRVPRRGGTMQFTAINPTG